MKKTALSLALLAGLGFANAAQADASLSSEFFTAGKSRGTIYLGGASGFGEDYTVLGLGYGYYLFDGLQLGLDAESWLGADPTVYKVTPQIQYVIPVPARIAPYVGVFYRRTMVEELDDLDSYGARAGLYFATGGNVYAGVGYVAEKYADCEESRYVDCSNDYPEFSLTVAF